MDGEDSIPLIDYATQDRDRAIDAPAWFKVIVIILLAGSLIPPLFILLFTFLLL